MHKVKRLKFYGNAILGIYDPEGNLVREWVSQEVLLYHPMDEQLDSLFHHLEVKLMDELNAQGVETTMAAGRQQVSREFENGTEARFQEGIPQRSFVPGGQEGPSGQEQSAPGDDQEGRRGWDAGQGSGSRAELIEGGLEYAEQLATTEPEGQ